MINIRISVSELPITWKTLILKYIDWSGQGKSPTPGNVPFAKKSPDKNPHIDIRYQIEVSE